MKFIDKSTPQSKAAAKRLHDWRDGYTYQKQEFPQYQGLSLAEICNKPEFTGKKLWDLLNNDKPYRQALRKEQHNLCCYCCEILKKGDDTTAIEHFRDKGSNPCVDTFDYANLLLACEGNKNPRKYTPKLDDTWETIANHFNTTAEKLEYDNPNIVFPFQIGTETKFKLSQHCDVAKGANAISVNPTTNIDCWKRFMYDENGHIQGKKNDIDAQKTVDTLKLDCDILKNKRKAAWQLAVEIYRDDVDIMILLEAEDIEGYLKRIEQLKEIDAVTSFSPVYWFYYGKQLIN